MQFIRQNATHKVELGPFVDVDDGFTMETGVTLSGADDAAATLHDNSTIVDIAAYTFAALTNKAGYYHLTLQSGITGTVGHLGIGVRDDSVCLPVSKDFTVLEEPVYDQLYAAAAVGAATVSAISDVESSLVIVKSDLVVITSDTTQIASDLIIAASDVVIIGSDVIVLDDALSDVESSLVIVKSDLVVIESDTTVIESDVIVIDSKLDGLGAASGGGFAFAATEDNESTAIKGVDNVGTQTGTFTNTEADDASYHVLTHAANDIDWIYGFSVGGARTGTEVIFKGYLNSSNDDMFLQAFDFIGTDWETIALIPGQNPAIDITRNPKLLAKHTGTGSDLGKVYIRVEADGVMSSPVLNINLLQVEGANIGQSVGYALGRIWINTALSNTNTESFVDGTADNPVSTIAAALTISAAVGITDFHIINGSAIELAATADNFSFFGDNWTLALGGQSMDEAHVVGAEVNGTCTGHVHMDHCHLDAVSFAAGEFTECGLADTFTITGAASYSFIQCYHEEAGAPSTLDFGAAVGASEIHMHMWAGALLVKNVDTGDIFHFSCAEGALELDSTNTAGTVNRSGTYGFVNTSTGMSINDKGSAITLLDTIASDLVITASDVIQIYSDTTIIASDLVIVGSDVVIIGSDVIVIDDAVSDVESSLVIVKSDLVVITSDTTQIASDLVIVASDVVQVYSDTTIIASDVVVLVSDTTQIASDLVIIASDVIQVYSDTTIIASDVVIIGSDLIVAASDIVIIGSDVVIVVSDTTQIASDLVIVASDVIQVYSDTTIIASDVVIIGSDVIVIDAAVSDIESSLVIVKSDLVIITSDTTQIASDLVIAASDIVIIGSDLVIAASDVVQIYSDTTIIASDLVLLVDTPISELAQAAPSATPTLREAAMLPYMMARNKSVTQTSGTDAIEFYNDAGTKVFKKLITDDGSDYTEDEMTSGA